MQKATLPQQIIWKCKNKFLNEGIPALEERLSKEYKCDQPPDIINILLLCAFHAGTHADNNKFCEIAILYFDPSGKQPDLPYCPVDTDSANPLLVLKETLSVPSSAFFNIISPKFQIGFEKNTQVPVLEKTYLNYTDIITPFAVSSFIYKVSLDGTPIEEIPPETVKNRVDDLDFILSERKMEQLEFEDKKQEKTIRSNTKMFEIWAHTPRPQLIKGESFKKIKPKFNELNTNLKATKKKTPKERKEIKNKLLEMISTELPTSFSCSTLQIGLWNPSINISDRKKNKEETSLKRVSHDRTVDGQYKQLNSVHMKIN
jgi:hypothetical protein